MLRRRPRVLVYSPEKGEAEIISRGLGAIPGVEFDVTLLEDQACRQLRDCRYDLLLVGRPELDEAPDLAAQVPEEVPVILVGGAPGRPGRNGHRRVPMPLSFTLLRRALHSVLNGKLPPAESRDLHRRDQVG